MPIDRALDAAVAAFNREVRDALLAAAEGVTGPAGNGFHLDVVNEAFNLVTAIIDADGRHTDDELWALTATFGALLPLEGLAGATPAQLRGSTLVAGKAQWLTQPSTLFEVLVAADRQRRLGGAMTYYHRAMDLAHTVAALGDPVSETELAAISAWRSLLLSQVNAVTPGAANPLGQPPDTALAEPHTPAAEGSAVAPPPPARPLEEVLAELDQLIGLTEVKSEVRRLADLLTINAIRASHQLPGVDVALHQVFVGNPGTGKTTVARLLAEIYHSLGVSARGQLVETDRSGMVAGFVGQTAPLVTKRFDEADGGVLFVDEAYALARGNEGDFGREAIDQMVKLLEDRRDRVIVIVAGYPEEMADFIAANPGLGSRFPRTIVFGDYSTEDLLRIFDALADRHRYTLDAAGREILRAHLDATPRTRGFGNGRYVRNVFEAAVTAQATRLVGAGAGADHAPDEATLTALVAADVDAALAALAAGADRLGPGSG